MTKLHCNNKQHNLLIALKKFNITANKEQLQKLSSDIKEILTFQKSLPALNINNLYYPQNCQELIEIFALRSKIYKQKGYDKEFPQFIDGLDYDDFDKTSAILFVRFHNKITASCKIVFDSYQKLPLDKNYSLNYLREKDKTLCELSRLVKEKNGLGLEQKLLVKGTYTLIKMKKIDTLISITDKKAYFRYYKHFGGFQIEHEFNGYGKLDKTFIVSSWDITKISPFFKRVFLKD